ncbi:EGF domain-specific O-GlcNAc transferase [Aureococcus anophagefferens]|uniref:EGF domain-specific O-linked N-acetylglucosamine transferase n=1 Tax=Aureococcus anophagefferens TaxID=44056 RepID=A0ABR1FZ35_AURAN
MAVVLITLDHHSRQLGVAHTERVVKQYIVREEEAIVRGHRIIAGKVQGALGLKRDDDDDDGAAREMPEEHAVDDFDDDDDDDDAGDDDAARADDDDAAAARKAARDDDDDGAARPADRAARPPRAPKRRRRQGRITGHAGHGDNLCEATNVRLNFADFADGATATRQFERYVAARHAEWEAHVSHREGQCKGSLAADCDADPELWQAKHFPGWNAHWADAFARVDDLECDVWEDAPTLVVERDTFANLFHDSEDFVNAFIALAVLRWSTADLQILLTDIYPEGPFWDMWSKVFRGTRPPLTAWQIGQKYGAKNVCFKKVAIGILGAAAPTTLHTSNTRCKASSVVRAYSDFVIRGLGLQGAARYAAPDGDPKDVVVTFLARRSSSEWPEKRFCDSETSFFDCAKLQHLGVRGLGRTIENDGEVVRALKSLETRSFANGARVRFRDVDYNLLSFEDQIKVDLDTDVMVGPHGAGLLHNIFMPDRGHLVELGIDGSSNLRHFHNLATWQGRAYTGGPMANPVPVDRLLAVVAAAVAGLDLSKPY